MPTYQYRCKACGIVKEVTHSMKECDEPSDELIEETSCGYNSDCQISWAETLGMQQPSDKDLRFEKVIHATTIQGSYGGSSLSGAEKRATVRKERKQRSHEHFKKEIFPTIPKPEQRFFEKKWKQQGK